MYIFEQPKGAQIELEVHIADQSLKLTTQAKGSSKVFRRGAGYRLDCDPVIMDGKQISFGKHMIILYAHNPSDGRVYKYPVCATSHTDQILCFFSKTDAKPENFRGAFRVPCSYRSTIKIGDSRTAIDGITHDISFSGAAYIFTSSKAEAKEDDHVYASIFDEKGITHKAGGRVVRVVKDFTPGFTLIGVQFDHGVDMHDLVSRAQLEEIRKIRH